MSFIYVYKWSFTKYHHWYLTEQSQPNCHSFSLAAFKSSLRLWCSVFHYDLPKCSFLLFILFGRYDVSWIWECMIFINFEKFSVICFFPTRSLSFETPIKIYSTSIYPLCLLTSLLFLFLLVSWVIYLHFFCLWIIFSEVSNLLFLHIQGIFNNNFLFYLFHFKICLFVYDSIFFSGFLDSIN